MELSDLADHVGEARFREACAAAWSSAAGTGQMDHGGHWPKRLADIPYDLVDLLRKTDEPWPDRLELFFQLYRKMPSYGLLMYIKVEHFFEWNANARELFWNEYRQLLSAEHDELADPVGYSLWADYFEDPRTVEEAWRQLARSADLSERGLERLLTLSGPVPFGLKAKLYDEVLPHRRWHPFIFRSLLGSAFDYFGQIDHEAARRVLEGLALPESTEGLRELRAVLDQPR
jgi:hypothetical protein